MSEGDNTSVYIYNGVGEVPMDVTHVRVDSSVTVIPANAFRGRDKLDQVELPEGLITIERRAFYNCQSLEMINLPSTLEIIGPRAFQCCENLEAVILPEGLQTLGNHAFQYCKTMKTINIPPGIEVLEEGAFLHCWKLVDVICSEGITEIEKDAFSRCFSLVSVTLPSTLTAIGEGAFEGSERLNKVHMPKTIETIDERAFKKCNFTSFRVPPSLGNDLDISIVGENRCLVSLELPETVERLDDNFHGTIEHNTDLNVRNIAIPLECVIDTSDAFRNCTDLGVAFPDTNDDDYYKLDTTISDALKQRFDNLLIHKICYYQSYSDNETTLQHLKREINPWTAKSPGKLNKTGKQQDCLGMTPLHILACSTKPTFEMFRILIEKYPETLIMKDKWGDIPLLYALWCNAPTEVLELLVESYKSLHPEYEFDWKDMLLTMVKRNVPLANIQRLITTQQKSYPDQEYDLQQVVIELATYDTGQASFDKPFTFVDIVQYLLRISITKRLESLAVSRWSDELENSIKSLHNTTHGAKNRDRDTQAVYDRLETYESIKEGTSIIELVLWKAKIDEGRKKRARVEGGDSYREQCHINCGADIIIRNVLPYLLPDEMTISRDDSSDESSDDSSDSDDSNEEED